MTQDLEEFERLLKESPPPKPDEGAKEKAVSKAMAAFDKNMAPARREITFADRFMDAVRSFHDTIMGKDFMRKAYIALGIGAVALVLLNTSQLSELMRLPQERRKAVSHHKERVVAESEAGKSGELSIAPGSLPAPPSELASPAAVPPPLPPPPPQSFAATKEEDELKAGVAREKTLGGDSALQQNAAAAQDVGGIAAKKVANGAMLESQAAAPVAMPASPPAGAAGTAANEVRDKFNRAPPNPVRQAMSAPVSTFSAGANTSSYSLMRAALGNGALPEPGAVRTEEFINHFPYEYEAPESRRKPFKASVSVFPTPWNPDTKLMRIGIRGYGQKLLPNLPAIANNVKIEVEFNPARVAGYRLIGYEGSSNGKVDAGDVGAGRAVTALYEITPVGSKAASMDELRDLKTLPLEEKDFGNGEYAFIKIRYNLSGNNKSSQISTPVDKSSESKALSGAPQDARFAAAVAAYAQLLKGDASLGHFTYDDVIALARGAMGADPSGYRAEFINLVELAKHIAAVPERRKRE